jgi:hypothetical protein
MESIRPKGMGVYGKYMESIWEVYGKYMESIWEVYGKYTFSNHQGKGGPSRLARASYI